MMAQIQKNNDRLDLAPKKFNMWIFIFTSFMFFAALTSGFIVYSGGRGHGLNVIMPDAFKYSTAVIIISSITLFLASRAAKQLQFAKQRLFLWLTFALGVAFFAIQVYAWYVLTYKMNVYLTDPNASRSFVYIFTGMHLLHIIAAILLLLNTLAGTYKNIPQVRNLFKMEMTSIFWHFLGIIWIYLYVFLLLNQN
ncbi:cytochrome c oxidase subunit 3 [Mucilaginibacter lappiensis]|uniref:Cytochrome c oxidase subunit 3 n=1 Tax=Mucilaginibacter lappiensis TaxID=354630 RepID=A0A1N7GBA4_9SPHI|nr:cytochrome c oxidase subunit 3 [Mucilaginibacter lappiensis]MBB6112945.1 cytochrome c oxidase subunit 3 [Mucilaginibacter lappiensis]MBB6130060.1 cytochrome c oxidase subunit 3 [Mucilaginibacter lappiensis]SIS09808.1 cytochrome c oxidase subunit 3 [Mucilaginibacter lappiensis]